MYLAHKCPQCHQYDVVYHINDTKLHCVCGYTENEEIFWRYMKMDSYLRELEIEIEKCYPYREISIISNQIDLMIGYHITGRHDARDSCLTHLIKEIKDLYNKWGICYSNFIRIEKRIVEYEALPRGGKSKNENMYVENIKTSREFFKDFPEKCKAAIKEN